MKFIKILIFFVDHKLESELILLELKKIDAYSRVGYLWTILPLAVIGETNIHLRFILSTYSIAWA